MTTSNKLKQISQRSLFSNAPKTEGKDIDECRAMLRDALNEMVLAYQQTGKQPVIQPEF